MKTLAFGLSMTLMCLSTRATADTFGTATNEFGIEFVEIGDPGNAGKMTSSRGPGGAHRTTQVLIQKKANQARMFPKRWTDRERVGVQPKEFVVQALLTCD